MWNVFHPKLHPILQTLEGENIEGLNVPLVRSSVGVVSQEPVLFRRSIADNIRYGANSRGEVPMEEVVAAAKKANIHDFIESLPEVSPNDLTVHKLNLLVQGLAKRRALGCNNSLRGSAWL